MHVAHARRLGSDHAGEIHGSPSCSTQPAFRTFQRGLPVATAPQAKRTAETNRAGAGDNPHPHRMSEMTGRHAWDHPAQGLRYCFVTASPAAGRDLNGHDQGSYRYGRKVHRQSSAYNVDKYGVESVYVPKIPFSKQMENFELNVPMVYLPLHRSHLDYILVTYLLYLNDMRLPLVAAGDNLLIPLFGQLLRGLGGFFIKRRLDFKDGRKDHVYRAVLKEGAPPHQPSLPLRPAHTEPAVVAPAPKAAVAQATPPTPKPRPETPESLGLKASPHQARTKIRTNKPACAGIQCLRGGNGYVEPWKDILIVPISISYEKLLDGNFVSEQLGEPKVMETFTAALTSIWKILHSNYGAVRVDFCQPFSLMEFLNRARISSSAPLYFDCPLSLLEAAKDSRTVKYNECTSTTSLSSPDGTSEETRAAIKSLANHVVHREFSSSSV
ncbi:hypothetical protein HPB51_008171 [Rhipicephalus microplus]|uniref:Phospholipid/glycerol acyltransferase domain-containing protein n=1 Tax=Rhipicephalus microplus TaxID=6941 RepID=A0A9J6D8X7_RHIMP|nr:hypothetical protein HPB51_008171 [Rhipicephalus microplus]